MARYRIYSETLPWEELTKTGTLALLGRYRLEVVLAVQPSRLGALARTALALRDAGVSLSLWPMLEDADGRWASVRNADRFDAFVRRACDALAEAGVAPADVMLDMEPPFSLARTLADAPGRGLLRIATRPRGAFASAERAFARTAADVRARGATISAAVWPLVALDPPGGCGWQAALGTPVDALGADYVSVMMYTSIVAGWSRGTVRRRDAVALLDAACARTVARYGRRGGVSLGCIGHGAFHDEPVYGTTDELAEDAAVARASGCGKLALFDLGGVLARRPAEAWLEALVDESRPAGRTARASRRVAAVRCLARAATWALSRA